jgi:hypothetical protein
LKEVGPAKKVAHPVERPEEAVADVSREPAGRLVDGDHEAGGVPREDARVAAHQERAPRGDVLGADRPHPEVAEHGLGEKEEDATGEYQIEPVRIGRTVEDEVAQERRQPKALSASGKRGEPRRLLFPGGADDMLRPVWRRYRLAGNRGLKPGHGGYIKASLRTGSPIVPVACVGTEEIHMMLGDMPALARLLGVPFFPIVASPFPLPARIYLRFGRPIRFAEPPAAADDQATVDWLNGMIQQKLQALIDDTRRHRRGVYWSRYDDHP